MVGAQHGVGHGGGDREGGRAGEWWGYKAWTLGAVAVVRTWELLSSAFMVVIPACAVCDFARKGWVSANQWLTLSAAAGGLRTEARTETLPTWACMEVSLSFCARKRTSSLARILADFSCPFLAAFLMSKICVASNKGRGQDKAMAGADRTRAGAGAG